MIPTRSALALALAAILTAPAAAACPAEASARAALAAGDLAAAEAVYEPVQLDPACPDSLRADLRSGLATLHFAAAATLTGPDRLARLDRALRYQRQWPILAARADLMFAARDYAPAAEGYQAAINRLADTPAEGTAGEAEIARLFRMASAALALSDTAPQVPSQRDGTPGGIFTASVRGYAVRDVSLPITFVTGTTQFDDRGAQMADQLAQAILAEAPPSLTIEGHTDPVGGDAYNVELSIARAVRVAEFLVERGYQGQIDGGGYGESAPPDLPPGIAPASPEAYRLARRVELKR